MTRAAAPDPSASDPSASGPVRRAFQARRRRLEARAAMVTAIRHYFAAEGFVEVETPALQPVPGGEVHVRPFATTLEEPFGQSERTMFLHTSPEFAMKTLLAGGMDRIFQLAHAYRNGERSPLHHPEFTMLEWYRAKAGWRDVAADCRAIVAAACAVVPVDLRADPGDTAGIVWNGRRCDPGAKWEFLSFSDAFLRYTGIDILATDADAGRLRSVAGQAGHRLPDQGSWEDLVFHLLLDHIEPRLGSPVPTVLHDYPAAMASLARLSPADPRVAERFEIYMGGVEVANGYGELNDPTQQRARFLADEAQRKALYGRSLPLDEAFLAALAEMPPAAGVALGFDRLVMLLTGARRVEDVLWAAIPT
ncbi:MAG: EF-P lysine aminoacylase EpmA [Alphaproteobacteria bacterium]